MKLHHTADYRKKRAEAYPPVQEQLDMLWHAMNNGDTPKVEPFFSTNASIKAQFPKVTVPI